MTGQQLPVARIQAGPVSAAIWENEVQTRSGSVKILKASVQRRYKDRNGVWQSTTSFSRNEIPLAIHCLQQAFEQIIEKQNEEGTNGEIEEIEVR